MSRCSLRASRRSRRSRSADSAPGASLIVTLGSAPGETPVVEIDRVAQWFALTPAEARLAVGLAGGQTLQDYAALRAVSLNAVRFLLKGIFRKTGATSQAQLVAMLARLPGCRRTLAHRLPAFRRRPTMLAPARAASKCAVARALTECPSSMQPFHHLLFNNLVANITNFTVWFALTFWTFLETKSVFATGMIAGIYLVLTAALGIWFGSLVDHHRKRNMMLVSSLASLAIYGAALGAYALAPDIRAARVESPGFWLFILLTMIGVIVGNIRMIALPTLVTLLVPEGRRDKANGLVGMVSGIGFLTTSAISGFLVAGGGMVATLGFAILLSALAALAPALRPYRRTARHRRA